MQVFIAELKARLDPAGNPYFRALREGTFDRADFVETQAQFLHAVEHFARPMLALAARHPDPAVRWALLENVADEHGRGDPAAAHGETFRALLARLGVDTADLARRRIWPEVRAFNATLLGVCQNEPLPMGLAMLGVIEDLFAGFSAWLGRALVANGWLRPGEVVHYATHERLDCVHAADFYRPVAPLFGADPSVRDGLELGAHVFLRLYTDLYAARERRWRA